MATAETAAVRISVIGDAFMIATSSPGLAVVEQDAAHVRVEPARRVVGRDDDLLERVRGRRAAAVSGHEPEQLVASGGRMTERSGL